ncbi:aldo/keto reductase [Novosphingobium sp. CF614]|uniref:aldo/keto reductase n=1 Tax=Novosphingobium sp. CF614 TaxID=1884364 RepID=UPI0015A69CD5|nr:aldo/keto reductase [Novosphingobium sp. CF614]
MRLGFGGAALGNLYRAVDDRVAEQTLAAAWDGGMRLFDTAPYYGLGRSEQRLGAFLGRRPRDAFRISTKVGRLLEPDAALAGAGERHGFVAPLPYRVRFDYSYDGVMRSHESSLERLGLDRIDILLVHDIGVATHGEDAARHFADLAEGGYRALDELRRAGDVGMIGLGVNEWQACVEAMTIGQWDRFLLAGRYTLLEQEPLHGFLPGCLAHGAKIILGGVFNSGILASGTRTGGPMHYNYQPAPPEVIARVGEIEAVCDAHAVDLAAAALQFPLAHPAVEAVIPGLARPAEVDRALTLAGRAIPDAFWTDLVARGLVDPAAPLPVSPVDVGG